MLNWEPGERDFEYAKSRISLLVKYHPYPKYIEYLSSKSDMSFRDWLKYYENKKQNKI